MVALSGAVHQLPQPALRRIEPQRRGRGGAPGQLPAVRRRRQPRADGRGDAQRVRQRLLRRPALPARGAPLRPGALQRRLHRRARPHLRVQRRAVPRRLHRGHGAHGQHRRAHGESGTDQGHLLQGELTAQLLRVKARAYGNVGPVWC
uniref:Uncharacterized protein n=1 Tax=Arundo donax TaxID=35708 RepID=A0A0A9E6K0_ARUDO